MLLDDADHQRAGTFRVTHVQRLRDAVAHLARDGGSDVVLLDLGLPDARGMEALTGLLDAAPDLPLVVLSGLDDERLALEAVLRGAQDCLIKGQGGRGAVKRAVRYAIERKRAERRLHLLARSDPLTGLANRALFQDRLIQALHRLAGRDDRLVGLIFIDLDGFKPVNDRYGHDAGDRLLRMAAERLLGAVRRTDTVARMGGDEFTVVLEGLRYRDDALRVAEKILAGLFEPFHLDGVEVTVGASLGVALADRADQDADILVRQADVAMYRAKAGGGRRWKLYDGAAFEPPSAHRAVA
jgi:diguanylate cyclase (GGDEF)-like protein